MKKLISLALALLLAFSAIAVINAETTTGKLADVTKLSVSEMEARGTVWESSKYANNHDVSLQKRARWTNSRKTEAEILLSASPYYEHYEFLTDVDVVFIADCSYSMKGDRFDNEKAGLKAAAAYLVEESGKDCRVALVKFAESATQVIAYTQNLNAFNAAVDGLTLGSSTNYGAAFTEAYDMITNHRGSSTREPDVVFVSDGLPTAGLSVAQTIKSQIQDLGGIVYGLQYMMGTSVTPEFASVTTNDRVVAVDNVTDFTDAMLSLIKRGGSRVISIANAVFTDTLMSQFRLASSATFSVTQGTVTQSGTGGFTWNIGTLSGSATLYARLVFPDDTLTGNFPTNNGNAVLTYADGSLGVASPVLPRNRHTVTYTVASGHGYQAPVDSATYWEGDTVSIKSVLEISSDHDLLFRGWNGNDIDNTRTLLWQAGETFEMPDRNVTITAIIDDIGTIKKTARSTPYVDPDWLVLDWDNDGDTMDWRYKTENSTLYLWYVGDSGTSELGEAVQNEVAELGANYTANHASGHAAPRGSADQELNLSALTTVVIMGKVRFATFVPNPDYCTTLDFSQVEEVQGGVDYYGFTNNSNFTLGLNGSGQYATYYVTQNRVLQTIVMPNRPCNFGIRTYNYAASCQYAPGGNSAMSASYTSSARHAASGCIALRNINIPENSYFAYDSSFLDCRSLQSITLPNTTLFRTTSELDYMFYNCSALASVSLPNTLTSIGGSMFQNCHSLTSITIPQTVTSIGGSAFSGCENLRTANLPSGLRSMGNYAFSGCSSLQSVTFPTNSNFTSIPQACYRNCTSLTNVTIPENVTQIKSKDYAGSVFDVSTGAFGNCTNATITVLNRDAQIGRFAFVALPDGPNSINIQTGPTNEQLTNTITKLKGYVPSSSFDYAYSMGWVTEAEYDSGNASHANGWVSSSGKFESLGVAPNSAGRLAKVEEVKELEKVSDSVILTGSKLPRGDDVQTVSYGRVAERQSIDFTLTVKGPNTTSMNEKYTMGTTIVRDVIPDGLTLDTSSVVVTHQAVINTNELVEAKGAVLQQNGADFSYNSTTRELKVMFTGLASNAQMTIRFTCTVDNLPAGVEYKEYFNTATISEENITHPSNTTWHYTDKRQTVTEPTYNVVYKYIVEGTDADTFLTNNNIATPVDSTDYNSGATVTLANTPTVPQGWNFAGWDLTNVITEETVAQSNGTFTMPAAKVLAVGVFTPQTYTPSQVTVRYEYIGDFIPTDASTLPATILVNVGSRVTVAPNATTSQGRFNGWTLDGEPLTAGSSLTVTKDIVIYGTFTPKHTVTYVFDSDVGAAIPAGVTPPPVEYHFEGENVTYKEMTDPSGTYIFDGWYSDDVIGTGPFTMPDKDVVLIGYWYTTPASDYHNKLVYVSEGMEYRIEDITNETHHTLVKEPLTAQNCIDGMQDRIEDGLPIRDGFLFGGWYTSAQAAAARTESAAYPQSITLANYRDANGNVYLYAGWVAKGEVNVDANDPNKDAYGTSKLIGFDLEGIQIKSKEIDDEGVERATWQGREYDGLRFITVYRNGLITELENLYQTSQNLNWGTLSDTDVMYGYTMYAQPDFTGISGLLTDKTDMAVDVDCTRTRNMNHKYFTDYRLSTAVVMYEGADQAYLDELVEARAYIDYIDANAFTRRGYDTYGTSKGETMFAGGCRASFNQARAALLRK
ncbi:MAG: leucine-rich repeat protein [Clostridiales bacterium]|nr:leucine-rich repeat protein [Clostridiales bacterium]